MIKKQQYTTSTTGNPNILSTVPNMLTDLNKNKVVQQKNRVISKKEQQIDNMSNEEVVNELKEKKLPTFGTVVERKDRLKKHYGIGVITPAIDSTLKDGTNNMQHQPPQNIANMNAAAAKKSSCLGEIERLKQNREDRRKKMEDLRKQKTEREQFNEAQGIKVDVDFQVMVETNMRNTVKMSPHIPADQIKICVCVKKRPIFSNELASGEIDCVSATNPNIIVHECKYKVDGITKFIDNQEFEFDNAFSHDESNHDLYFFSVRPILDLVFNQGIVTVFAYGQTGSGKTFTMQGLQELAIKDLFDRGVTYFQNHNRNFTVTVSMYEIYGGKIYDLLNNHEQLKILEDKSQKIQIQGLKEQFVQSEEEILQLIGFGNSVRTTHATKANDTSSRSHAVCQIKVHEEGFKNAGRLLLVDLAGSERAQDCQSNNKDRQQEGAEINKSLLALKESNSNKNNSGAQHVPFRSSKLTMVLRDSFMQGDKTKIIMLTCICPGSSSADHTLNTLRYAERLKERSGNSNQNVPNGGPASMNYNPQQLEEQLRVYKKQNSLKYLTNDHDKEQQPVQQQPTQLQLKKAQTNIPTHHQQQQPKQSTITRESVPLKPNKDMFYPQNQNNNDRSFSDYGNEEMRDDDIQMIDEPTAITNQSKLKQAPVTQKNASPQSKMFQKQQQNQNPTTIQNQNNQKHNFQQQPKSTQNATSSGIVINKNQSKIIQNKLQQQQQQQQLPQQNQQPQKLAAQFKKQDAIIIKLVIFYYDSFLSDEEAPNNNLMGYKNMSPRQNQMKSQNQSNGNTAQIIQRKSQDPPTATQTQSASNHKDFQMKVQTPPKQIPYQRAEENILNGHLECVKEEAQLITQEGELITKIEKAMVNDANYDMKGYLDTAENIARKKLNQIQLYKFLIKLEMYSKLLNDIGEFKRRFGNEL